MLKASGQRIADQTTIHSVKDFYYGNTAGKFFWGLLSGVALVCLVLQLQSVVMKFYKQNKGATLMQFAPDSMPGITICPDAWVSKDKVDAYNERVSKRKVGDYNLTESSVTIIDGFFPLVGINHLFEMESNGNYVDTLNHAMNAFAEEFLVKIVGPLWQEKANKSIARLVEIVGISKLNCFGIVLPMAESLTQRRVITWSGVCFRFENDLKVNSLQSVYAGVKLAFNVSEKVMTPSLTNAEGQRVNVDPYFKVFLGRAGELDLTSLSESRFEYGKQYILSYSVMKITRISTRKWPCRWYTPGDRMHCMASYGNAHAKGSGPLNNILLEKGMKGYICQSVIPETNSFNESSVDTPCNLVVDSLGSSVYAYSRLPYTDREWNAICPQPCQLMSYQYTARLKKEWSPNMRRKTSFLEVKAAQDVSGMEIQEYLLLTAEGMLSNIGGTMGLWLGASFMSLVQIVYLLCLQERCMQKKTKATIT